MLYFLRFLLLFTIHLIAYTLDAQSYQRNANFGVNGRAALESDDFEFYFAAAFPQDSGLYFVANGRGVGDDTRGLRSLFFGKLGYDGKLDPSYGTDGLIEFRGGPGAANQNYASSALLSAQGNYILSMQYEGVNSVFSFDSQGKINRDFNQSGYIRTQIIGALSRDQNGWIVNAGSLRNGFKDSVYIHLYRFNEAGDLDPNFGNQGHVETNSDNLPYGFTTDVQIGPAGNIYVLHFASWGFGEFYPFIYKFLADGRLDSSFVDAGRFQVYIPWLEELQTDTRIHISQQGDIYVLGTGQTGNKNRLYMAKYNAQGQRISEFGDQGTRHLDLSEAHDGQLGDLLVLDPNTFVVSGYLRSQQGDYDIYPFYAAVDSNGNMLSNFVSEDKALIEICEPNACDDYLPDFIAGNSKDFFVFGRKRSSTNWGNFYTFIDQFSKSSAIANWKHRAEEIKIYPNPARERLYVNCKEPIMKIQVLDLSGRVLIDLNSKPSEQDLIDISPLPFGSYQINIKTKNRLYHRVFVKG